MRGKRRGNGNAMVELLVVAAVLVPICLWIPKLGKLGEINQSGVQAARYALWERTVSGIDIKPDETLLEEVKARVIHKSAAPIITQETADNHAPVTRISHAAPGEYPLISDDQNAILLLTVNNKISGAEGTQMFTETIDGLGGSLDGLISGADWDVESKGLMTVRFAMAITAKDTQPTDCAEADLDAPCWTRSHTMFTDSWYAASPQQVARRSKSFVPAGALEPIGDGLSYLGAVPLFEELKKLKGAFGTLNPDVLPLDRFGDE